MYQDQPRTLLISPYFDARLPSGGVLYSLDVAREWLRRGRHVGVLCAAFDDRQLGDLADYVDSGRLTLFPLIPPDQTRFTHHPDASLEKRTQQVIEQFAPQVIHVHNTQGMLSAVKAAVDSPVPTVFTALDFGLLCFNYCLWESPGQICSGPASRKCAQCILRTIHGPARSLGPVLPQSITRRIWPRFVRLDEIKRSHELLALMRHVMCGVDVVIAPSPVVAEHIGAHGAAGGQVTMLTYGVAPEKVIRPAKTLCERMRLAFLGGVDPIKGLQVLTAAADLLPSGLPLEIMLFGGEKVGQVIAQGSPRVKEYFSHQPACFGEALGRAHADFDATLVSSIIHENSPFAVLESLANGTPVLASDSAGIRHLILQDHNGWLIPPNQPRAWAAAIARALQCPARIRSMQINARYPRTTADFVNDVERIESHLLTPTKRRFAGASAHVRTFMPDHASP